MSAKKKKDNHTLLPSNMRKRYEDTSILDFNDAPDELKMSAKVLELIEPWDDEIEISILADCAAIAWNQTLKEDFDTEYRAKLKNTLLNFDKFKSLINTLKTRKRKLFPNDSRIIKEIFFVPDGDDKVVLNVVSEFNMQEMIKNLMELSEEAKKELSELEDT